MDPRDEMGPADESFPEPGQAPTEALVREWQKRVDAWPAETEARQIIVALCDSWLAQKKRIEELEEKDDAPDA